MERTNHLLRGVRAYIKELGVDGVYNQSHRTLRRLYQEFGEDKVNLTVTNEFARAAANLEAVWVEASGTTEEDTE